MRGVQVNKSTIKEALKQLVWYIQGSKHVAIHYFEDICIIFLQDMVFQFAHNVFVCNPMYSRQLVDGIITFNFVCLACYCIVDCKKCAHAWYIHNENIFYMYSHHVRAWMWLMSLFVQYSHVSKLGARFCLWITMTLIYALVDSDYASLIVSPLNANFAFAMTMSPFY